MRQRAQTAREVTEEIDRATDAVVEDTSGQGRGVDLGQARGLGGLAVGQVLTYNPENAGSGVSRVNLEANNVGSGANNASFEANNAGNRSGGANGFGGSNRGEGDGGAALGGLGQLGQPEGLGRLGRLEHPSVRERENNERVREIAEIDNGYARNEIDPNLSSVGEESKLEVNERLADDNENLRNELSGVKDFEAQIQAKKQEDIAKAMVPQVGNLLRRKSFAVNDVIELQRVGRDQTLLSFERPRKIGDRN